MNKKIVLIIVSAILLVMPTQIFADTTLDDSIQYYKVNVVGEVEVWGNNLFEDEHGQVWIESGAAELHIDPKDGYTIDSVVVRCADGEVSEAEDGSFFISNVNDEVTVNAVTRPYVYYDTIEGDYQIWSGGDLRIVVDADREKLLSVTLGEFIPSEDGLNIEKYHPINENLDYTVESGSTVFTLKEDFIKTLEPHLYCVEFVYSDGIAWGNFEKTDEAIKSTDITPYIYWYMIENGEVASADVSMNNVSPKTGDDMSALWIMLFAVLCSAVVVGKRYN